MSYFGVGMRGVVEEREGEGLEAVRYIFERGEGSPASQISLGDGLKSLEEGVDSNNKIVNTSTIDMAIQYNTGPLLDIRFLVGGGEKICGEAVAGGSRFFVSLCHECSTASHNRPRKEG